MGHDRRALAGGQFQWAAVGRSSAGLRGALEDKSAGIRLGIARPTEGLFEVRRERRIQEECPAERRAVVAQTK